MAKIQQVMYPENGGQPLPRSPLVNPRLHDPLVEAARYVAVLKREMDEGSDEGYKWRGRQRAEVKRRLMAWEYKASGKDAYYNKRGTARGPETSPPPSIQEYEGERLKRAAMDRGDHISNVEHKRRGKPNYLADTVKAFQKRMGGKDVQPKDD